MDRTGVSFQCFGIVTEVLRGRPVEAAATRDFLVSAMEGASDVQGS